MVAHATVARRVVAPRAGWKRPAAGCQVFGELEKLLPEPKPDYAEPGPEDALERFVRRPGNLGIRHLLEVEDLGVKLDRPVHGGHGEADHLYSPGASGLSRQSGPSAVCHRDLRRRDAPAIPGLLRLTW